MREERIYARDKTAARRAMIVTRAAHTILPLLAVLGCARAQSGSSTLNFYVQLNDVPVTFDASALSASLPNGSSLLTYYSGDEVCNSLLNSCSIVCSIAAL